MGARTVRIDGCRCAGWTLRPRVRGRGKRRRSGPRRDLAGWRTTTIPGVPAGRLTSVWAAARGRWVLAGVLPRRVLTTRAGRRVLPRRTRRTATGGRVLAGRVLPRRLLAGWVLTGGTWMLAGCRTATGRVRAGLLRTPGTLLPWIARPWVGDTWIARRLARLPTLLWAGLPPARWHAALSRPTGLLRMSALLWVAALVRMTGLLRMTGLRVALVRCAGWKLTLRRTLLVRRQPLLPGRRPLRRPGVWRPGLRLPRRWPGLLRLTAALGRYGRAAGAGASRRGCRRHRTAHRSPALPGDARLAGLVEFVLFGRCDPLPRCRRHGGPGRGGRPSALIRILAAHGHLPRRTPDRMPFYPAA